MKKNETDILKIALRDLQVGYVETCRQIIKFHVLGVINLLSVSGLLLSNRL